MVTVKGKDKKAGKGIKKSVLKKEVKHEDFKSCLFEKSEYHHQMMGFRSHLHQVYTEKQMKKSLSPFDDKRFILGDGFTTRAHGHHLNGIRRPSEAAAAVEEGLVNALSTLSPTTPNYAMATNVMEIPRPPPVTTNSSYSYLRSFWS